MGAEDEQDDVDEKFLEHMDATAEGGAYVGRHGEWRSVRDTWCNSHRNVIRQEEPEEASGVILEETSERDSEAENDDVSD